MTSILGVIISALLAFSGLVIWAKSDLPIIIREIAINTRKNIYDGPNYTAVKMLSILLKIGPIVMWLIAFFVLIVSVKYGKEYDKILFGNILK
jgi:hypothetical protein